MTRDLMRAGRITGAAAFDARIAAVCLQHGVTEMWSHDRDFSRFPALRSRNPLVELYPTRAGEARAVYRTSNRQATTSEPRRSSRPTKTRART